MVLGFFPPYVYSAIPWVIYEAAHYLFLFFYLRNTTRSSSLACATRVRWWSMKQLTPSFLSFLLGILLVHRVVLAPQEWDGDLRSCLHHLFFYLRNTTNSSNLACTTRARWSSTKLLTTSFFPFLLGILLVHRVVLAPRVRWSSTKLLTPSFFSFLLGILLVHRVLPAPQERDGDLRSCTRHRQHEGDNAQGSGACRLRFAALLELA